MFPKDPFGGNSFGPPIPTGGIRVGNRILYPDLNGDLHSTPGETINANQRIEDSIGRGLTGGCGQDPSKVTGDDSR